MRIKRYVATLILAMVTSSFAAAATVAMFVQHSVAGGAVAATSAPDTYYDM